MKRFYTICQRYLYGKHINDMAKDVYIRSARNIDISLFNIQELEKKIFMRHC